jgi:hypothetical protein
MRETPVQPLDRASGVPNVARAVYLLRRRDLFELPIVRIAR